MIHELTKGNNRTLVTPLIGIGHRASMMRSINELLNAILMLENTPLFG